MLKQIHKEFLDSSWSWRQSFFEYNLQSPRRKVVWLSFHRSLTEFPYLVGLRWDCRETCRQGCSRTNPFIDVVHFVQRCGLADGSDRQRWWFREIIWIVDIHRWREIEGRWCGGIKFHGLEIGKLSFITGDKSDDFVNRHIGCSIWVL